MKPIWQRLLELDADADAAGIEMDFHVLHREELNVFPLGTQEHIRQQENVEAESRGVSVSEHAILPLGSGFRPKICSPVARGVTGFVTLGMSWRL